METEKAKLAMIKAVSVRPVSGASLELVFSDGSKDVADLSALIARGGAMVEPLADPAYFAQVFLEAGAPSWPNGFDLAPWALHKELDEAGALDRSGHAA